MVGGCYGRVVGRLVLAELWGCRRVRVGVVCVSGGRIIQSDELYSEGLSLER